MTKYKLRPYQQEVVNIIDNLDSGRYLISMATGLRENSCFYQY